MGSRPFLDQLVVADPAHAHPLAEIPASGADFLIRRAGERNDTGP